MKLIKRSNLEDRAARYPDVEQPLANWVAMVRAAAWENPHQLVQTSSFPARTIANGRVIFNVKGNEYRLICAGCDPRAGHGTPSVGSRWGGTG